MGNTETHSPNSTILNHYEKRFIRSPHPLDPEQNLLFYMHERLSDNKYILRIVSTNDSEDRQRMEELICKKLAMNNRNNQNVKCTVIPIDHYIFEEDKGYCNSISKCYMLFNSKNSEPLSHHLARGYYNRSLQKNITEDTVYRGLLNLIEGVALLKYYNHPHRHINCDTVYYYKDNNTFVLGDPWISPLTDFHEQYHAPEKLKQMRNQVEKHDPYLADLFSIGMVGLKMLGHANLPEHYSLNKTVNLQGLVKLTESIKHSNLRSLILKLLSQNIQVRDDVLNQTKMGSESRVDLSESNVTKTRNLTGKVSSVRKSFQNQDRVVAKFNRAPQQQSQYGSPNQQFTTVNGGVNPFLKNKEPMNSHAFQKIASNLNDKPQIDMSMPITPSNLLNNNQALIKPNNIQSKPVPQYSHPISIPPPQNYNSITINSQTFKPALTPTTYQASTLPFFPSNQYINGSSKFNGSHYRSNESLIQSQSTKMLKNVSSTPVNFINQDFNSEGVKTLSVSFSQQGLLFSNPGLNKIQITTSKITQPPIEKKQQTIAFSVLKKEVNHKYNIISPATNASISSPGSMFKSEKQEINPLRTNHSYPSSQSFESDHFSHQKLHQNIKILENKISEAINTSRVNISESRASGNSGLNLQNSGRLIESVIVAKDQQVSSHSTVKAINEELKGENSTANQAKNNIEPVTKQEKNIIKESKLSPILVRESQQSSIIHEHSKLSSDESHSQHSRTTSNQESLDFLNINSIKESQQQKQKMENLPIVEEEKFEDVITTPAKGPNVLRLQGNNLTIPEESDQQSYDGQRSRNRGEYVEEIYQNGGKYLGYMLNGQRHGNGVFYYRDGGYYDGRWKQNMMNGYGKLFYETGKLAYEGQWYQDEFHGRGTVHNDQPEAVHEEGFDYRNMNESQNYWQYYEGDLSHDMKARYGKLMLSNGEYYEGEFKNDQVHGKGQFHCKDGTIVKGMWSEGYFIKQL